MNTCPARSLVRLVMVLAGAVVCLHTATAQKLDLNLNGLSDVWEQLYNAQGLSPNVDSDGDGAPNWLESIAGTDPLNPASVPRIPTISRTGSVVTVTLPCELGKQYQLQSIQPVTGQPWTNWVIESTVVARSGTNINLTATASTTAKFYRVGIADVDTDGDGLSDWEEYKLGLDPTLKNTTAFLDANGQLMSDYSYATNQFASQNVVSVYATDPTAYQPDPSGASGQTGMLSVRRGGFPLTSLTVNLDVPAAGPGMAIEGIDYAPLPRTVILPAGVSSLPLSIVPYTNTLLSPAAATLRAVPGTGYTLGTPTNASVTIYPPATPLGTGLLGQYYTNANATYANTANFNAANLKLTRVDTNIDFNWGTTNYLPITNSGYYCVRWTGQVLPQYTEQYYFFTMADDGVKLWVNDQLIIDSWSAKTSTGALTGSISLQGGTRYNLKLEYYNISSPAQAHLGWYSWSQAMQIIPPERLFPGNGPQAPASITSPLYAYGYVGQPFGYTNSGANTTLGYSAGPIPPGLTFTNGILSGIPSLAGEYQIVLTATNSVGISSAVLDLTIFDTGSAVSREVWTNAPGTNITDIPLSTPANITNSLGTLEGITDYGDNYAERIRGFITIVTSGNYYFWIAGSDAAELWISNDEEPVNKVKRAYTIGGTGSRQWTVQPKQKSGWLALQAGQKYYVEVLHKAGTGAGDNWSVGWLRDPSGTNNTASGVVPGYMLSRYFPLPPAVLPGTLYAANLLPEAGVVSSGNGSSTLRLSADNTKAILKFNYSNLSSPVTGEHIHADPTSEIIFDIDEAIRQPDGSYVWNIVPIGTFPTSASIVQAIQDGRTYINIHTVNNPAGEINGHFGLAAGRQVFTPPAAAPPWTDDHSSSNAAARFLIQSTFGPTRSAITNVQDIGYAAWISNQFLITPTYHLSNVLALTSADPTLPYPSTLTWATWWKNAITAPDPLRQRMAFALSEIMVVSDYGVLSDHGTALSSYYDTLLDNAFGNFRTLLRSVTLHPAMGLYLDMRGNAKGVLSSGLHPNENYAREIMQLFSVGLYRMWPDGELVLDSQDNLVPTYNQNVIMGFAATFTGWNYNQALQGNGRLPTSFGPPADYINPMVLVPSQHELGSKLLLDNVVAPFGTGTQTNSTSTNYDIYCSNDLELAMDSIFYNENVGPFICRELIQRLVTSNPSPEYLYRVVQAFNNNGAGVRGDMAAVVNAILLDYEARSTNLLASPTFGKQREPLLRVAAIARAFPSPSTLGATWSENGDRTISVTSTNGAHKLLNGETVLISFTEGSGQLPPPSQAYAVSLTGPTSFTVSAPGMLNGTYSQSSNVITVTIGSHGLAAGAWVYLQFVTGGASNAAYQVAGVTNSSIFTVTAGDTTTRSGNVIIPKLSGTGTGFSIDKSANATKGTNCTVGTAQAHGLQVNDSVWLDFTQAGNPPDGKYVVTAVPDAVHFVVTIPTNSAGSYNANIVFPLIAPVVVRSGTASIIWSTWNVGATDTGSPMLSQTPLRSPTVFNFFFPGYKYPGTLAAAGLTTPEFQLTSDTEVVYQMNYLQAGIFNPANTNGYSSFNGGGGAITLDFSPWMTPGFTSNAGLGSLVDALNTLLCGGQLNNTARTTIINYVATLPYTTPTSSEMRDRVRAAVHLITASPDFTIQH